MSDESFYIILTIEGTQYEEVEVAISDPHKTIRELIERIVEAFMLPKMDYGGNPITYLLGRMNGDDGDVDIFEFDDENGRELCLLDYKIFEGDHLCLISCPIAGGCEDLIFNANTGEFKVDNVLPIEEGLDIDPTFDGIHDIIMCESADGGLDYNCENDSPYSKVVPEGIDDDDILVAYEQEQREKKEREQREQMEREREMAEREQREQMEREREMAEREQRERMKRELEMAERERRERMEREREMAERERELTECEQSGNGSKAKSYQKKSLNKNRGAGRKLLERLKLIRRIEITNTSQEKNYKIKPLKNEKRGAGRKLLERLNLIRQTVYGSIFAPAEIKPLSHLLVQVYLHLNEETEIVKRLAKESQKGTKRRDHISLYCKLKKGDKVDVLFTIHGKTLLMSEKKSMVWQGSFTKCSFDYFVPYSDEVNELYCIAMFSVNGIPVGEMSFVTSVVDSPRELNPEVISRNYQKVFISYSHKDISKVKGFHEGLKLFKIEHFFDKDTLETGAIFSSVIEEYINSADLFVLFWSENAAQSDYVQKEINQALKRAYPQVQPEKDAQLRIHPYSIEPRADLPVCMKPYYHFGEM